MKWFEFPRKPGWTSRDPAERLAAVRKADAAELAGALPSLAVDDPAPAVRAAALERSGDLDLLAARMRADPDAAVRTRARERLVALLIDDSTDTAAVCRWIEVCADVDLLRRVATSAHRPEVRRAAILRIDRPALLAERCRLDPDPALRLELLGRIDDLAVLDRLAEAARRSDKRLAHAARERAEALRVSQGDRAARQRRTLAICARLAALRQAGAARDDPEVCALAAEWDRYAPDLEAEYGARVRGHLAALEPPPVAARSADAAAAKAATPPVAATTESPTPNPQTQAGHALPARAPTPDGEAATTTAASGAAMPEAGEARRPETSLRAALDAYAEAVAAGNAARARRARGELLAARAAPGSPLRGGLLRRFEAVEAEYTRLARWQHWANNKVRARLCDAFEAWLGTGPHPDAVATRVRELKAEWARLDALKHDSEGSERAPGGLDRRLHALIHRALAPARPYFEKRQTLRNERHAAIEALLAEALPEVDAPGIAVRRRRQIIAALRDLDQVDPSARGELGKRLRARLAELDARLATAQAEAAEARRKLIAATRRALAKAKLPEALEIVREAEERLRQLPRSSRAQQAALDAEFHALIAPWLAQADTERARREAAEAANAAECEAILAELARLAAADEATLRHADAAIQSLRQRWEAASAARRSADETPNGREPPRQHGARPRAQLEARRRRTAPAADPRARAFERGLAAVEAAVAAMRARQAAAAQQRYRQAADWCARLEAALLEAVDPQDSRVATCIDAPWPLEDHHDPLARELAARRDRALDWARGASRTALEAAHGEALAAAQRLAIRAEILRGVPSPEGCRSARRAFEIARLQERLAGGAALDPALEREQIARDWLMLGPLTASERAAYAQRIDAA